MLTAVVGDLLAIPNCHVSITLDQRLDAVLDLSASDSLLVQRIGETNTEQVAFEQLVSNTDATLVIAPETDGILGQRVQRVADLGGCSLNCLPAAIAICGDKLRLADHLSNQGIATIPTSMANLRGAELWNHFETGCVLKPRDGAGSWLTFGIPYGDSTAWENAVGSFVTARAEHRALLQPWIAGHALSVGCLCDDAGSISVFPVAHQHLSGVNFQYRGGTIPAALSAGIVATIEQVVWSACESVAGLRGYIGIDLLLPDADPKSPLIVEINPRITTSYVGYRQLCFDNIGMRMLHATGLMSTDASGLLKWKPGSVSFAADGQIAG